jgi:hypothetical protein
MQRVQRYPGPDLIRDRGAGGRIEHPVGNQTMCAVGHDDHHGPGTIPSDNFDLFTAEWVMAIKNFRFL